MSLIRLPALLLCCVIASGMASAQQRISSSFVRTAPQIITQGITGVSSDTIDSAPAHVRKEKSGTLAMGLSALLPGAGQVYAERYYTIPIIWGAGGFFVSQWITADRRYRDFRGQFSESVRQDSLEHKGNPILKSNRDIWHDVRDEYAIYLALTYILNIVDAYVGANLYGFDVSDDLGSAAIRLRIPLH